MINERPFIRIGGDYINLNAISYVKHNADGSFTVYVNGDHSLTVNTTAKEFESFMNDHTVLGLLGDLPTGGRHSGPLR